MNASTRMFFVLFVAMQMSSHLCIASAQTSAEELLFFLSVALHVSGLASPSFVELFPSWLCPTVGKTTDVYLQLFLEWSRLHHQRSASSPPRLQLHLVHAVKSP